MNVIVITGTGTDIGKTIATAAIASCARLQGKTVAVVKPIQTGTGPDDPGDLTEVNRLTGIDDLHEYARFAEPLAPATAARRANAPTPSAAELATSIHQLADRDLVIVEGAGGALVRLNSQDETLLDLARQLASHSPLELALITSACLGSLHSAAATAHAITAAGLTTTHLVVGDWPAEPGLAERENLLDLPDYSGTPLTGVIAAGAGQLGQREFEGLAIRSLDQTLGGSLDVAEFTARHAGAQRAGGRA